MSICFALIIWKKIKQILFGTRPVEEYYIYIYLIPFPTN